QLSHEQHSFRIIAVHVQDRRLDHLRYVGCILGGTSIRRVAGSEADLVVDHDMDRATGLEAANLRHLEGFHNHALTGERRVTVDGNRQDFVADRVVTTILTGAHRALDHGRNDLQVGRVERHRQVNFATGSHHVGGKPLVILDVAGAQAFDLLALEFVEQVARVFTEGIDQHVQAATVGHANDDFLETIRTRTLDDLIHHRDQAFTAFETKTLGTRVLGAQVFLQAFSCSQTLEQVALNVSREGRTTTYAFQTLGKPVALLGINDVVEFGTNGAAIRL